MPHMRASKLAGVSFQQESYYLCVYVYTYICKVCLFLSLSLQTCLCILNMMYAYIEVYIPV